MVKLSKLVEWLDKTLDVASYPADVSNNGIQLARTGEGVKAVAVAVDASAASVRKAAECGAQLLVVHHGFSWGGGVKRITGGVYNVVKAATKANVAIYACHLPLDAHPTIGNNACLARMLKMTDVEPAFSYHGYRIGLIGKSAALEKGRELRVGVCSGGGGEFAEEAKALGCDVFVTGEADWGNVIAAQNCGIEMLQWGHYETEVHGVSALGELMARDFKVKIVDLTKGTPHEDKR